MNGGDKFSPCQQLKVILPIMTPGPEKKLVEGEGALVYIEKEGIRNISFGIKITTASRTHTAKLPFFSFLRKRDFGGISFDTTADTKYVFFFLFFSFQHKQPILTTIGCLPIQFNSDTGNGR